MRPKARTTDGRTFTAWSKADVRLLRQKYKDHDTDALADILGKTPTSVRVYASRAGISKTKAWRRENAHQVALAVWKRRKGRKTKARRASQS